MGGSIALRPSYWACVSGGKDSLYMLNLILHNLDRYPLTGVVHYELDIDYPFIRNVIDYMEEECKRYGIPFIRMRPTHTWEELYDRWGFPTARSRWCNSKYKMDAARQVRAFLRSKGLEMITYIGYCADEEKRYAKRSTVRERYPLVEEGITEDSILSWAKDAPIFNDFYKFNKRCGCMYCPLASRDNLAYLAHYYPDEYSRMMSLADATEKKLTEKLGRPFGVFRRDGTQVGYIDKTIQEKYLPRLRQKLEEMEALT